jgi:hypothetical protein
MQHQGLWPAFLGGRGLPVAPSQWRQAHSTAATSWTSSTDGLGATLARGGYRQVAGY